MKAVVQRRRKAIAAQKRCKTTKSSVSAVRLIEFLGVGFIDLFNFGVFNSRHEIKCENGLEINQKMQNMAARSNRKKSKILVCVKG